MSSVSESGKPKRGIISSLRNLIGSVDEPDEVPDPGEIELGQTELGEREPEALELQASGPEKPVDAGLGDAIPDGPPAVGDESNAEDDALILDPTMQPAAVGADPGDYPSAGNEGADETTVADDEIGATEYRIALMDEHAPENQDAPENEETHENKTAAGDDAGDATGDDGVSVFSAMLKDSAAAPAEAVDAREDGDLDAVEPGQDDLPGDDDVTDADLAADDVTDVDLADSDVSVGDPEDEEDGLIRAASQAYPGLSLVSSKDTVDPDGDDVAADDLAADDLAADDLAAGDLAADDVDSDDVDGGDMDGGDPAGDPGGDPGGDGEGGDDTADKIAAAPTETVGEGADGADDEPAPESGPESGPETVAALDPQELEDTVRRVIREELAGEMGQRLSQNIKQMVRDEISRSLLRRD